MAIKADGGGGESQRFFQPLTDEVKDGIYYCRVSERRNISVLGGICQAKECIFRPRGNGVDSQVTVGTECSGGSEVIIDCHQ